MLTIFFSPVAGKRRKGLDPWEEIGGTWSIVQHPGGTERRQAAQTVGLQLTVARKSERRDLQHSLPPTTSRSYKGSHQVCTKFVLYVIEQTQ